MSYYFDGGASSPADMLYYSPPEANTASWLPGSMVVWFKPDSYGESNFGRIWTFAASSQGRSSGNPQLYMCSSFSGQTNTLLFQDRWTTTQRQEVGETNAVTLNQWNVATVSYDGSSTSNRPTIYINGSLQTLDEHAAAAGVRGLDGNAVCVGTSPDDSREYAGDIAHLAYWNVELTAGEHLALNSGVSPLLVRPANLLWYVPLVGHKGEVMQGFAATTEGTPDLIADNPNIFYPQSPMIAPAGSAAPPAGANPHYVFGHPLAGPFAGPIG